MVREESEAKKRGSEIQMRALAGTEQGLRDEVARWEERLGETEEARRKCREELGRCQEKVMNKGAAAGSAEERRGEEEARRWDAELQVRNVGP
jgi:chromosome segregation ATPase